MKKTLIQNLMKTKLINNYNKGVGTMNLKQMFLSAFLMLLIFNGYVWTSLFKGYREFYMETIDSLEDDRVRLQLKIDELTNGVRLDGLDVVVTMYHPVRHQTDRTPDILADGTKITIHKASEYNYVAVSRNLLKRWGGWLDYGDFIVLSGTDGKDGVYQVKDTMNKRFVNRIDILESPGVKPYKFENAKILKTDLSADIKFVTN